MSTSKNTSTSLQALAALAALGSAALVSATPADAARGGGFRSAPAGATVSFNRAPARSLTTIKLPGLGLNVKVPGLPKTGLGTALNLPNKIPSIFVHPTSTTGATTPTTVGPSPTSTKTGTTATTTPTTSTTTSTAPSTGTTASHPVTPPCDFNCAKTSITPGGQIVVGHPGGMRPAGFPMRPQFPGRPGIATSAPMMSPGPAYVAPAVPVATQPSAPAPVQPSCLRQAVTQDGQVVTFDICTNQAVVGPLAQTQTQPQTQTQTQ